VHGSLLPKYRGAGPIQWAIINGETETGITTMLMDEGMDTGAMLLQATTAIAPDDTAGSLSVRLADLGGRLLIETVAQLKAGTLTPRPQNHTQATLAPLLKKEDGAINWTMSAASIANRIRGLTPWPGAYTFSKTDRWTISLAAALDETTSLPPGQITALSKDAIHVATGNGVLAIRELQPANSRRMSAAQYLAGHPLQPGMQLSQSDTL
jgi:methionyl-tRNA formyltransferase